jgi:hypothetical protein
LLQERIPVHIPDHTPPLDADLRDWLARASGFFVDPSVTLAAGLDRSPISEATRRVALPDGTWSLLEKGGRPFVVAGIQRLTSVSEDSFIILEYCVTGASRVSFWERSSGEWQFLSSDSAIQ